jgi:hypothetical protein
MILAGAQDNGTDRLVGTNWSRILGGDGMDCMVDPTNDQTVYASYQNGALRRSLNQGNSFSNISPSGGAWVTPFAMHPFNSSIIYAGCDKVYRSPDRGNTWDSISGAIFNDNIISMEVAPADPNHIYAATYDQLFHTADGGANWTAISNGLPVGAAAITAIATSKSDPLKVWVTFSGYSFGDKVFRSNDGGVNWTNVSGTLPNLPVNCIITQQNSADAVYIGTDMGVFYTDSTFADWEPFNDGLPNVIISDLEIHYATNKLRAATYGRGLWQSDLYVPINTGTDDLAGSKAAYCFPNPTSGQTAVECPSCQSDDRIVVTDGVGKTVLTQFWRTGGCALDLSTVAKGVYLMTIIRGDKPIFKSKVVVE